MSEDVTVERYPIILHDHCIALIQLFMRKHDRISDIWTYDYLEEVVHNQHEFAANQFVEQLENHWTPAFMMALRKAITRKLEEHDKEFGTNFANRDQ